MARVSAKAGSHQALDSRVKAEILGKQTQTEFTYRFEDFFHPAVGEMIEQLNRRSLDGLYDPAFQARPTTPDFFSSAYTTLTDDTVRFGTFPKKEFAVQEGRPYAVYNWEIGFHIPFTVFVHLSRNQRFNEAHRWCHKTMFDPTCNDTSVPAPARYWKFLRFRQGDTTPRLDDLLRLLSTPDAECLDDCRTRKEWILSGYEGIQQHPFQPHRVARTRIVAYQYAVVRKYLDRLIAWGDSLFRQDTIESINEATLRYVMAANVLGPRPQRIPPRGTVRPKTFAELRSGSLDAMGNALVELEGQFPFNVALPSSQNGTGNQSGPLFGIGRTLYFCIPPNDKLLGYWDLVADRLYKIRHCMNIQGAVRQLALFDPPIDPGMLVKAAAAGIDIGGIVSGLNQPIGPVRSPLLIQRALELAGEVRGLGNALLSAIEKTDGERLALLRQSHEINVHKLAKEVRFLQWKQAQESTETLLRTRAATVERYGDYLRLQGLSRDTNLAPDTFTLDRRELTEENFDDAYGALVGQYEKAVPLQAYPALALAGDSSPTNQAGASSAGKLRLITQEDADLNVHSVNAKVNQATAWGLRQMAPILGLIPQFPIHIQFWGLGGEIQFGGEQLSKAATIVADIFDLLANMETQSAAAASKTGSFERRADEWALQHNLAARELMQLGRQIIGSLIAEQVAHHEYRNTSTQMEQAQQVDTFLRGKFSNEELYQWMQGELSRLYYEYYRFAFDTARRAERTMKQELMRPELDGTDFVKFNYWDGGRKGLLTGEALFLDLKRMELAYHEQNRREFEITRHISVRQLDPLALLGLKATGTCEVSIPEWLFDLDFPGHYARRLKSVAVSVPAVVGPYTSVNCTVTLLRSTVRRSPLLDEGEYVRHGAEDGRFVDYYGSMDSIVTSSGTNDAGMFETNLRDDRFLPFEGAGAVSAWRLQLPDARPFDYSTISDVILHLRYTSRAGGDVLGTQAAIELKALIAAASTSGLALLFSLRHDFPTEWAAFARGTGDFTLRFERSCFPYFVNGDTLSITSLDLYATNGERVVKRGVSVPAGMAGDLNGPNGYSDITVAPDTAVLSRTATDVFLIVRYSAASTP